VNKLLKERLTSLARVIGIMQAVVITTAGEADAAALGWASERDRAATLAESELRIEQDGELTIIDDPAQPIVWTVVGTQAEDGHVAPKLVINGRCTVMPGAQIQCATLRIENAEASVITNQGVIAMECEGEIGTIGPRAGSKIIQDWSDARDGDAGWTKVIDPKAYRIYGGLAVIGLDGADPFGSNTIYAYDQVIAGDANADGDEGIAIRDMLKRWFDSAMHDHEENVLINRATGRIPGLAGIAAGEAGGADMTAQKDALGIQFAEVPLEIWRKGADGEYRIQNPNARPVPAVVLKTLTTNRFRQYDTVDTADDDGKQRLALVQAENTSEPNLENDVVAIEKVNDVGGTTFAQALYQDTAEDLVTAALEEYGVSVTTLRCDKSGRTPMGALEKQDAGKPTIISGDSGLEGPIEATAQHVIRANMESPGGFPVEFTGADGEAQVILEGDNSGMFETVWKTKVRTHGARAIPREATFWSPIVIGNSDTNVAEDPGATEIDEAGRVTVFDRLEIACGAVLKVKGKLTLGKPPA
jgi:hypothetical protein